MSDLTEILKMQWEAYPNALKTGQDAQANAIALDNARRAQQEREGLKALYARQAIPSFQAVGAIDPAFAIEQQKAQMQLYKDQIENKYKETQSEQIKFKMGKEQQDLMMKLAAATIDEYDRNIEAKMPQAQALDIYNRSSSRHLSENKQRGIIPPEYPSFDPESMNPEALRTVVKGQGFPTEKDIRLQEYEKSLQSASGTYAAGVPPQKPIWNEQLQQFEYPPSLPTQGLTNATPTRELQVAPGTVDPMEGYARVANDPSVPEELRAIAAEKAQSLMPKINAPQATSEQNLQRIAQQKADVEGAVKTAQIEATEKAADKKAIETYLRGPKPEAVRNLIKESIEGDVQSGIARLGKFFGVAVPGGNAKEALHVITQQMARALPYAPGSASDIDVKNRLLTVGNPASDEPITNRLRAMDEVFRDAEAYIVQKGDFLSEDQIYDSIENGYLSEASALEMLNNRMLNKGNPIYAPTQGNKTSTGVK